MKSVSTAASILELVSRSDRPIGVSEIAVKLGLGKAQVSKVLAIFRDRGFLSQDSQTRKFSVGLLGFAMGTRYASSQTLSREALPVMRRLSARCDHSVTLSVMHGDDVIHLMAVEGPLFLDGRWRVGNWLPYYASSAGKVLVAFMSDDEIEELLVRRPLERLTVKTLHTKEAFWKALKAVRNDGYSVSRGESQPGLGAIAVPVFSDAGTSGALGVVFPAHLVPAEEEASIIDALHHSARELSARMGAPVYRFGSAVAHRAMV